MTFFPSGAAADRILQLLLISTIVLLAGTTAFAVLALILRSVTIPKRTSQPKTWSWSYGSTSTAWTRG
jgi:hypothetical protein